MSKKRVLLWALAVILALLACGAVASTALYFSRRTPVVVCKSHLLAGAVIAEADVETRLVHPADVPAGALEDPAQAVGQRVKVERWPGDILVSDHIGEAQVFSLAPDEAAIAVTVDRASGLAGLLRPGDRVTVIGVIATTNLPTAAGLAAPVSGAEAAPEAEAPVPYAHIYLRGMRVLFVHHEFVYSLPQPQAAEAGGLVPISGTPARQAESGVVLLAVPVPPQPVTVYYGTDAQIRFVSPAELVALLNSVAKIHLALDPLERAADASAYGIRLTELLPISSTLPTAQPTPAPEVTP